MCSENKLRVPGSTSQWSKCHWHWHVNVVAGVAVSLNTLLLIVTLWTLARWAPRCLFLPHCCPQTSALLSPFLLAFVGSGGNCLRPVRWSWPRGTLLLLLRRNFAHSVVLADTIFRHHVGLHGVHFSPAHALLFPLLTCLPRPHPLVDSFPWCSWALKKSRGVARPWTLWKVFQTLHEHAELALPRACCVLGTVQPHRWAYLPIGFSRIL